MKRSMKKIAIFSHRHLGDVIFVEPLARVLQERGFEVVLFTRSSSAAQIAGYFFSKPKKIIVLEGKSYRRDARLVRDERCEAALLLNFSLWAALVAFLAFIPKRFGRDRELRGFFLTKSYKTKEKMHALEYHQKTLHLFSEYFHLDLPLLDFPKLAVAGKMEKKERILFQLGTTRESKKIPLEIYKTLLSDVREILKVSDKDISLALCGDDDEAAKSLEDLVDEDFVCKTDLDAYVRLIASSTAIFSPDTSAVHIASGFGVKVFGFYGSTSKDDYGPLSHDAVVFPTRYACQPCYKNTCLYEEGDERYMRCLKNVDVKKYRSAFETWLLSR